MPITLKDKMKNLTSAQRRRPPGENRKSPYWSMSFARRLRLAEQAFVNTVRILVKYIDSCISKSSQIDIQNCVEFSVS